MAYEGTILKPSQLGALLEHAIPAGQPVIVVGAPGLGKTDVVEASAAKVGHDCIVSHPAVEDPTDSKGLPFASADGKSAHWLPYGDMLTLLHCKKPTVAFMDDFGQAPPSVQAAKMQLILGRRLNGMRLPDHVTFVAATNRREDRSGVSGILEAVKSRFMIVHVGVDADDWLAWAQQANIEPVVMAYIAHVPSALHEFEPKADIAAYPCPRGWGLHVNRVMKMGLPPVLEGAALEGCIGKGQAVQFAAFVRLFRELVSADEVFNNPDGAEVPSKPDRLYATCAALLHRAEPGKMQAIVRYISRVRGEYAMFVMRGIEKRKPDCLKTSAFVQWATSPQGKLVMAGTTK